jgi:hypothetical protein
LLFPIGWNAKDKIILSVELAREIRLRQRVTLPFCFPSLETAYLRMGGKDTAIEYEKEEED